MRRVGQVSIIAAVSLLIGCSSLPVRPSTTTRGQPAAAKQPVAKKPQAESATSADATGLQYERSGNYYFAYQAYSKAIELDPKSLHAHQRLGAVCDRLGKFDEAEAHYKKALELSPRDPDIYNDLGYSYYLNARMHDAETALRTCLSIRPNHARAHTNLGLVLGRQGRLEESLAEFRRGGATEHQAAASLAFVAPKHSRSTSGNPAPSAVLDPVVMPADHAEPAAPNAPSRGQRLGPRSPHEGALR